LFDAIQVHGKVNIISRFPTSSFSVADKIETFVGSEPGCSDGTGLNACFKNPAMMCLNPNDECLYVCDEGNNSIRKITLQGNVSTFVGSNKGLNFPSGIAINHKENVFYVTNYINQTISKITSSGNTSVFAGSGQCGRTDGVGANATFNYPISIAIDQHTGNLFVSDQYSHTIRKITPQGEVTTLAGSTKGFGDGNGKSAKFNQPQGIWFDENSQSLLVCDLTNSKLRRVQLNGNVSTLCDIPLPLSVAMTANNTIFVTSGNEQIYKIKQTGENYQSVVIAGSGENGRVDGKPDKCSFNQLYGIAVHEPSHSCFVSEHENNRIRKIAFTDS
jgi:DNA-binding beta-propeller fold protein YncE